MSRIGKMPIALPKDVKIDWREPVVKVSQGKVTLARTLHPSVDLIVTATEVVVKPKVEGKDGWAIWGLTRTLVNNMVLGVTAGFSKKMELVGVGYKVELTDPQTLKLSLGFSNPVLFKVPEGVEVVLEPKSATKFALKSADKELLGLTAARIRAYRKPEPYKGKGIRFEGEVIRQKVGKAGGKAGK
ncbi:MAG: 50S ribosomal protein L6 [Deltaproteobacteria bacterium]|jgi:large subunit ribosomal protein L6|nr:50S ribosomal protein L6 [Deltaproteobacteria bacterium]